MIKLFSLRLLPPHLTGCRRGRLRGKPRLTVQISAQIHLEINVLKRIIGHLLYLNSHATTPTSAHTIVFVCLLNNAPNRQGERLRRGTAPTADAYYTDRHLQGKLKLNSRPAFFPSRRIHALRYNSLKTLGFSGAPRKGYGTCVSPEGGALYAEHSGSASTFGRMIKIEKFCHISGVY